MTRWCRTLMAALLAWLALGVAAQAQLPAPAGSGARHIRIELVADTVQPRPGGEVTLAFRSTPEHGWHGYWKNPGDAGIETTAEWTLPSGMTAGPIQYPVPQRLLIAGLMNYVYEGPFAQLVTLKVPAGAAPGTPLPVRVKLDYLVCTKDICVPESQTLSTTLTVGDGFVPQDRTVQFAQWRAKVPGGAPVAGRFELADAKPDKLFRLAVPFAQGAPLDDPYFYPLTDGAVDYGAPQKVAREGDTVVIETRAARNPATVEGVLAIGGGQGVLVRAVPGIVPQAGGQGAGASLWSAALLAFGGALLGGLILNIMPCVFPILSLKALSLAKANETDRQARGEALAYTAGVVLVCLALGGAILALRAAGSSAGWAFQLQDPRVILFLLLLVTAIAFNLAGLFEIATPGFINRAAAQDSGRGAGGAFMTGALAAFIATPCTGPFMGAALGAALILPWWIALLIFAGLGLGLALPFLALGFIPALRRRLPRPGAWMETFRRILSIPMFLTALALAWVLGRQAGVSGMTLGLAAALLLALGLWWGGARQSKGKSRAWLPAAPVLAVALAAVLLVKAAPAGPAAAAQQADGHEAFSETRLAALRQENKPVFVYFTADWCITCKVNERGVIATETVTRALADNRVAVLVGDWTNGDATLGKFIEAHNRAGVPLYLWYMPGESEPRVLPQILTQSMLADLAAGRRES